MPTRILFTLAMIAATGLTTGAGAGESAPQNRPAASAASDDWIADVTVVAVAPDGSWGVATEPFIHRAIAEAIAHCRTKYSGRIGCGYRHTAVRAGWSLGFKCGDHSIFVADRDLADAERAAFNRELELRGRYVPGLPACSRVVTIDPAGRVLTPEQVARLSRLAPDLDRVEE
jgi:hypothetical protein